MKIGDLYVPKPTSTVFQLIWLFAYTPGKRTDFEIIRNIDSKDILIIKSTSALNENSAYCEVVTSRGEFGFVIKSSIVEL